MVKRAPYAVMVQPQAQRELEQLRVFEHRRIVDAIAVNLTYDAAVSSRNRKMLIEIVPGFDFDPPLWELRVGEFRVFYDVNEDLRKVHVRAVRRKPPGKTTEEVTR